MSYAEDYLAETGRIASALDRGAIEALVAALVELGGEGRLFILGSGERGQRSHAVNDFRKICGIEAYTPVDNVSELTARVNDDGWESVFSHWLEVSRLSKDDLIFVLSVGGGDLERNVSPNLVRALQYAKQQGAAICGVVGRDGGHTAQVADACVIIPTVNPATVTPHAEAFQPVIWHLLVSHPALQAAPMKWESVGGRRRLWTETASRQRSS
jgi:D-sedoheptulose 7-phosphate isomerase